jgi:hypothetical protein
LVFIGFLPARGDEAGEPCEGFVEHGGVERVADKLAVLFRHDEVGPAQQVEVVGHAGQADREVARNLAHGQVALAQQLEDAAADGIVQCPEKTGHIFR